MFAFRITPFFLAACVASNSEVAVAQGPGPIFPNSVVSNDIDFITPNDPSAFQNLQFQGQSRQEMPSNLRSGLFLDNTYVFSAQFSDETTVPIWVDPSIGEEAVVADLAKKIAIRIGQLPRNMRAPLDHVVVNAGDHAAQEEADGGFFMLYADNVATRLANHDLSETVFHEAAHVSLQNNWLRTAEWQAAVAADAGVITDYARTNAAEDFAESALFAYTYNRYPERLPTEVRAAVETTIPNRTALFQKIIVD
ncbi:MAG: hypothetical protein AAFP98_10240 [Pseudomonadota bacterium]